MTRSAHLHLVRLLCLWLSHLSDVVRFLWLYLRAPAAVVAENLFLRKQLALYRERDTKPRRASNTTRIALVCLSRWAEISPLSSMEFYRQFQAGQTGDAMDYVEWVSLVQMADNLHKRLRLLTGETDA